jgi:four helix bundle protein
MNVQIKQDSERNSYRNLVAWQRAVDLVEHVYRVTKSWPRDETYGLSNQARRAAVSIPANIAEGQGRLSDREFAYHLSIAYGSLCELETHFVIALRLSYIDQLEFDEIFDRSGDVARPLRGLIKSKQGQT